MKNPPDIFAVFAVCNPRRIDSLICATTREDGTIGLPGGKVDSGEDIFKAVIREAAEEGWALRTSRKIIRIAEVDGKRVAWVRCYCRQNPIVPNHKEMARGIMPIAVPRFMLSDGMGNEFLK